MKARPRLRRITKWGGAAVSALIAASAAASLKWEFGIEVARWAAFVASGGILVSWFPPNLKLSSGVSCHPADPQRVRVWLWPIWVSIPNAGLLTVPLWMPFVLTGGPAAWLWLADRRMAAPGRCASCAYNLTGNVSGRCPECGAAVEPKP